MKRPRTRDRNRQVRIERPIANASFVGAGSGTWEKVAQVRASVQDVLPSRSERLADGINLATRPARVRMLFREDVTPDMRFVMGAKIVNDVIDYSAARIMQIVSGPAELGRREGIEFMVEDYSAAGNAA